MSCDIFDGILDGSVGVGAGSEGDEVGVGAHVVVDEVEAGVVLCWGALFVVAGDGFGAGVGGLVVSMGRIKTGVDGVRTFDLPQSSRLLHPTSCIL
jgi:hypothetical protein